MTLHGRQGRAWTAGVMAHPADRMASGGLPCGRAGRPGRGLQQIATGWQPRVSRQP